MTLTTWPFFRVVLATKTKVSQIAKISQDSVYASLHFAYITIASFYNIERFCANISKVLFLAKVRDCKC